MSGDSIKTVRVVVDVQENGIIRRATDGCLVGRLIDDVGFDLLVPQPIRHQPEGLRPDPIAGQPYRNPAADPLAGRFTTKYPSDMISGTSRNINIPPVARPKDIADRIYISAVEAQNLIEQPNPDIVRINQLLWTIRHGSTALSGLLNRGGGDRG